MHRLPVATMKSCTIAFKSFHFDALKEVPDSTHAFARMEILFIPVSKRFLSSIILTV